MMLATLLAALDQTIVATALPQIVADLHGFERPVAGSSRAYLLATTVTVPLYGKLSDLYGRRRLFVVSISIFLVGSALCGTAQTMGELIAFRALQGVGAGGLLPLAPGGDGRPVLAARARRATRATSARCGRPPRSPGRCSAAR